MRGTEFEISMITRLLLLLLVFLVIVVFATGIFGGMGEWINKFCKQYPELCGVDVSKDDYIDASVSVLALKEAIQCVAEPSSCKCIGKDCVFSRKDVTGEEAKAGFLGTVLAQEKDENEVKVRCDEKTKEYSTTDSLLTIYAPEEKFADEICDTFCVDSNTKCDAMELGILASESKIDYASVREPNTMLKCTCESDTKEQVYGLSRSQAFWVCRMDYFTQKNLDEISLYGCSEIAVTEDNSDIYDSLFTKPLLSRKELYSKAKKYECVFYRNDQQSEKYYVYGIGDDAESEARKICQSDIDELKGLKNPLDDKFDIREIGEVVGNLLFIDVKTSWTTRVNPLDGYDCQQTTVTQEKSLICDVENFNLPEHFGEGIFSSASKPPKEYIEGFGDPSFLVFFQQFPEGEDSAWKGWSSWYEGIGTMMFVGMCIGDFLRPVLKPIARRLLFGKELKTLEYLKGLEATKGPTESTIKQLEGLIEKVSKKKGVVEKTIERIGTNRIRISFHEGRRSTVAALISVLKEESKEWIAKNWKPAMQKAMDYMAFDSAASYAASRVDSEVGKFVYENPSSIVLQLPFKEGEPEKINLGMDVPEINMRVSRPVILDKGSSSSSFYLASPCHADLTVKASDIMCKSYNYDLKTGKIECKEVSAANENIPSCTFSQKPVFMSEDVYSKLKQLITTQANRKLSEKEGSEIKIHFPLFENKYLVCPDIGGKGYNFEYECDASGITGKEGEKLNFICSRTNVAKFYGLIPSGLGPKLEQLIKEEDIGFCSTMQYIEKTPFIDNLIFGLVYADDRIIAEVIYPTFLAIGKGPLIIFKDTNEDGNWEQILTENIDAQWEPVTRYNSFSPLFIFEDSDGDKAIDTISGWDCQTPSIGISAEGKNYKDDDHNFCYEKESWTGVAITTGMFVLDAFAKKIPNPLTWVASTAADCTLAYIEFKMQTNWPSGGIG